MITYLNIYFNNLIRKGKELFIFMLYTKKYKRYTCNHERAHTKPFRSSTLHHHPIATSTDWPAPS